MRNTGWFSRLFNQQPATAMIQRIAGGVGVAALLMMTGIAVAQDPATQMPTPGSQMSIPDGYSAHGTADLGGHTSGVTGSKAMYDTLVNLQSGPRVLGETFEMRALPGNKHPLFDSLNAIGTGFGGDPYSFNKLDFHKGKLYEFSGTFRRNRQYFDYDLLANPGIPSGSSIPISGSTTPYAWPQVNQSPFMYNTVRRMTDTNLTLLPLSKVTFHAGYSKNTFEGPSLSPSGYSVAGSEVILEEYQRNSSDDFTGGIDWKPVQGTKLTFEEEIDHNKLDSFFMMDPSYYTVQEADGTKVALLASYQNFLPYGYSATGAFSATGSKVCSSSVTNTSILSANPTGGLPIIDPACNVISSYYRSQPTREIFPTEIFRLQSTTLKNIQMNGDVRYTKANMNLPNYYEDFKGLNVATRELAYTAFANAKRDVIAADYGIVWQATKTVSLSDQFSFSNVHQPGTSEFTSGTTVTVPATAGKETINYAGLTSTTATTGSAPFDSVSAMGAPTFNYFGQKFVTNDVSLTWDATPRSSYSATYRHGAHDITEGDANITSSQTGAETFSINEDGVILNAALHPANNWDLNGSAEILYNDNAFTPVAPRHTRHNRVHTLYKPKTWATVTGAFNDRERHNNTNNTGAVSVSAAGTTPLVLGHEDHSRVVSLGANLAPNERYGLDLNYTYDDVYTATNICFLSTATVMQGTGIVAPTATTQSPELCYAVAKPAHGSAVAVSGPAKDFENAPTQYGSVALALSPVNKLHSDIGYRVSSVNGTRFFTDASDVNGSLVSTYQTPFVSADWTVHPGLIFKVQYDYFGYGEGGRSGAQYCSLNASPSVGDTSEPVVPCSSVPYTAMSAATPVYGFTAPRNFHANNVTLGVHFAF
jgi:hypothetical protein